MNTEERQLSDMLRRVTPEPPRRVTVEDVAFRLANEAAAGRGGHEPSWPPRERRGFAGRGWNRSWVPVLAAASVFVVAGASAGVAVGLTSHNSSKAGAGSQLSSAPVTPGSALPYTSPIPAQTQTSAGPTFPPESVAGGMWGAELINRQTLNQDSLTSGPDGLYAITNGYLDRINPANGDVANEAPYNPTIANPPVVTGNTVWVVSSYAGSQAVLQGYDSKTLAQVGSIAVPVGGQVSTTAAGVLTSGSGGYLYLAAGTSVAVINPATRQVIRHIATSGGPVNSVAVSPDGGRLYVSTGSVKLLTYNLATGALTGSSTTDLGSGGGDLIATSGGVWGTIGVGMTEWVWFAPNGNLDQIVRVSEGAGAGLDSVPTFSGGTVWIGGSHTLVCADPATGQVLASATIPTDHSVVEYFGSVTITGGHAYAYYLNQAAQQSGVAALTPPASCSG
jgi:YVTN family beta-propeller protein